MLTTKDERRQAVQIAKAMTADTGSTCNADEVNLLCRTVLDTLSVFLVHAPVIAAIKKMITAAGEPAKTYTETHHAELIPAVIALYRFDRRMEAR